jgi:prepilin-type N-terminal cleavage/methylation domain-containing protein
MNKHSSARPRISGFTLTELLVVVTLTAILTAMVLPSLDTASDTMKAAVCLGNMHEWGMAISMYCEDWNGYFPKEGTFGLPIDDSFNAGAWYNVCPRYINQPRLVDLYIAGTPPTSLTKSVWSCPSATNTTIGPPSSATPIFMYAFNARMDPNGPDQFKRSQLTSPANTIIFCEADDGASSVGSTTTVARHFGGGHFVLGDGHAEWIRYDDFCRQCPANPSTESDSSSLGDWKTGTKYHWFPYKGAPT